MRLHEAREYVALRRMLSSRRLTEEERRRIEIEMEELRRSPDPPPRRQDMRTRRRIAWEWLFLVVALAAVGWVVWFHCTFRVPTTADVYVGARLYHYDPWRSKEYMSMDVTAVHPDGTVELMGAGVLGWMAGTEVVTMDELTDGHHRQLRTEWVTR